MLFQGQVASSVPTARPTGNPNVYQEMLGALAVSEILGRYSNLAVSGQLFSAFATITSGVIFSTAAGTGGPLIYNATTTKSAHILAACIGGVTTANTVATSIGLTGNSGQTSAPTSTTSTTAAGSMLMGGPLQSMNVYATGTVANAGNRFLPIAGYGTGAISVETSLPGWIDLGGAMVIPPSCWGALSFAATATTGVIGLGLMWAELPV